jgi:hypothetical protein
MLTKQDMILAVMLTQRKSQDFSEMAQVFLQMILDDPLENLYYYEELMIDWTHDALDPASPIWQKLLDDAHSYADDCANGLYD